MVDERDRVSVVVLQRISLNREGESDGGEETFMGVSLRLYVHSCLFIGFIERVLKGELERKREKKVVKRMSYI